MTAIVSLEKSEIFPKSEMSWKKTGFERKHLSQPFDKKYWYQKNIKLSLILKNPELYNQVFAQGCIPLITKPTRVTPKTVSLIDHIFSNFIFDTSLKLKKKRIIKSNVSDHFPVFVSLCSLSKINKQHQKITNHKRVIHDTNVMVFKTDLHNVNWNLINHSSETKPKYETFFKIFSELSQK